MPTKTKKSSKVLTDLGTLAQQAGLLVMSAAVTFGMLETPDRATRIVIPNQPAFAWANENEELNSNSIRRENEETEQHYISYSVAQRTPSRSGRR